jgi:hypothetical protein
MFHNLIAALGLSLMLSAGMSTAIAQVQTDPASLLAEAETRLAADPADRKALVAAARASIVLRDGPRAIRYLEQLRIGSDNFAVRQALLLQYASAASWTKHATIIADVMDLLTRGLIPEAVLKREVFGLETFQHGDFTIRAFRHFEPGGPHRHIYTSVVSRPDSPDKAPVMITFGSTEFTDSLDKEQNPQRDYERLYSIDTQIRRDEGGFKHETLIVETTVMAYSEYRKVVVDYLDGARKPLSSSNSAAPRN